MEEKVDYADDLIAMDEFKLNEVNEIFNSNDDDRIQNYILNYHDSLDHINNTYSLIFNLLIMKKYDWIKTYFEYSFTELFEIIEYIFPTEFYNILKNIFENHPIQNENIDNHQMSKIYKFHLKIYHMNTNNLQSYNIFSEHKEYVCRDFSKILKIIINMEDYDLIIKNLFRSDIFEIEYNDDIIRLLTSLSNEKKYGIIICIILKNIKYDDNNTSFGEKLIKIYETIFERSEIDGSIITNLFLTINILFQRSGLNSMDIFNIFYRYVNHNNNDFLDFIRNVLGIEHNEDENENIDEHLDIVHPQPQPQRQLTPIINFNEEDINRNPSPINRPHHIPNIEEKEEKENLKDITVIDVKYKLLKKSLDKINNKISANLINEDLVNKLMNKRYEKMISFFIPPIKSKNSDFVKRCKTNTDIITNTDMDLNDNDIYPIGFMIDDEKKNENDNRYLHCFDKATLIRSFSEPMFIYRTNIAVYRLIYPMYWITQEAIIKIILSDKHAFKLIKEGDHDLGTILGVGNWHGGHINPVYNVEELDVEL
jgi:hypothetical protein